MNWLVYHIVSGQAFFSGTTLLIIASLSSTASRPLFNRISLLAFLVGAIAVVVSSTAIPYWFYAVIPYWFYAVATAVTLAWIASRYKKTWRRWAPYATAAAWLCAAFLEIPYHITPSLSQVDNRSIAIIGDSVTAGVGGDETSETWPSILARKHQLQVQDISHMGETAASTLIRAKSHQITAPVVVVEIGGNDILGSTTSAQFESNLDALLAHLATADRQIVMFELPLPPFYHEYGRVQRTVATRYNVILIPKRVFLSVIAGTDSTLDTIHLSQSGHQFMADCVWRLIRSAFETKSAA
ncbi:MAG: acyl-CoA thioesterase [Planctomycetes bacterium]|nr:acyl-CoA thioesterase [Planctomycetota bacterium]